MKVHYYTVIALLITQSITIHSMSPFEERMIRARAADPSTPIELLQTDLELAQKEHNNDLIALLSGKIERRIEQTKKIATTRKKREFEHARQEIQDEYDDVDKAEEAEKRKIMLQQQQQRRLERENQQRMQEEAQQEQIERERTQKEKLMRQDWAEKRNLRRQQRTQLLEKAAAENSKGLLAEQRARKELATFVAQRRRKANVLEELHQRQERLAGQDVELRQRKGKAPSIILPPQEAPFIPQYTPPSTMTLEEELAQVQAQHAATPPAQPTPQMRRSSRGPSWKGIKDVVYSDEY